jgi:hypothetical protein
MVIQCYYRLILPKLLDHNRSSAGQGTSAFPGDWFLIHQDSGLSQGFIVPGRLCYDRIIATRKTTEAT